MSTGSNGGNKTGVELEQATVQDGVNTAPVWASIPFTSFLDRGEEVMRLTALSARSISMMRAAPTIQAALAKATGKEDEKEASRVRELGELAEREVNRGFPLLYGQATITLWSSLEYLIKDFLVCWLINEPSALQAETIQKIKIPLSLYDTLTKEERYYFIIETLERETHSVFKQGVSRHESLLNVIGLGGSVENELQKTLFELSNVRNVLVHRRGIADRKLVEACPWLTLKAGDTVAVSGAAYERYANSVVGYALIVFKRVCAHFKVELWQDSSGSWHRRDIIVEE